MSNNKIKIISIVGPTASGKTSLSVELALALNTEVISADSMQIYKYMDIATAKPSADERKGVIHHLMDYVEPGESYSVSRYVNDALSSAQAISNKGKIPILVGGTGLYVDSLLDGIKFCEGETDLKLRVKLKTELEENGLNFMINKLSEFDPESAQKLSAERNPKRILRAMEVYYTTGVTLSEQNLKSKEKPSVFDSLKIGIKFRNRDLLYNRINQRVDIMLEQGLLKEAEAFFSSAYGNTAKQAIGYKELKPYFDGIKSLNECIELLKQSTRRYAKRQLTWFNRDKNIHWFYVDDYNDSQALFSDVLSLVKTKGFDLIENS
ncbi:MAG: tRNA (adenosine(37)-N6)-dimethylallyltransferase MiaA [Ruminococcus sp.]|nr:tRNA (adenosine(37)-N6)-dimethylallyltransferase MiaA [Ruminococcus sp.]